jgi:hypothetical protein
MESCSHPRNPVDNTAPCRRGKQAKGGAGSSAIDPATLVWPLPPDKPRVRYLEMFSNIYDIEPRKKRTWVDRMVGNPDPNRPEFFLRASGVAHGACKHCEAAGEFWKTTKRLLKQLQTQVADTGVTEKGKAMNPVNTVKELLKRFHLVARQLTERHKQRPTLQIGDEYDVQDLLHAPLRLHFDDIRPEEWAPSYGGGPPAWTSF